MLRGRGTGPAWAVAAVAVLLGLVGITLGPASGAHTAAEVPSGAATAGILPGPPTHAAAAEGYAVSDWSQFHGNESHDGLSVWPGPTVPELAWSKPWASSESGLTESDGELAVSSGVNSSAGVGTLRAINETTGAKTFSYSIPVSCNNACAAGAPATVYVPIGGGVTFATSYAPITGGCDVLGVTCIPYLFADHVASGSLDWSSGSLVLGSGGTRSEYGANLLTYSDGYLYSAADAGRDVEGFLSSSGDLEWNWTPKAGAVDTIPTVGGGLVVVGFSNLHNLTAIYAENGSVAWNYSFGSGYADAAPAFYDGTFYFGTTSSVLLAVSSSGSVVWTATLGAPVESTPAVAGGLVVAGADNGDLYALNASSGAVVWNRSLGGSLLASPAVASNGVVYEGSSSGLFAALNLSTGTVLWSVNDTSPVTSSPLLDDGYVFFVDQSGTIFAYEQALALAAPVPSTQTLDQGQTGTLTVATPTTGTPPYSYQWLEAPAGTGSYSEATDCRQPTTLSCVFETNASTAAGTYRFELQATDSAPTPYLAVSAAASIVVEPQLVVPNPIPSSQGVDQGQTASVEGVAPTTGTPPYTYQWLEEAPGSDGFANATACAAPTSLTCVFVTGSATPTGAYAFELEVTDRAAVPTVAASAPVTVTVNPDLSVGPPSPSSQAVDQGETATVAGAPPTTGTGPYTYAWLEKAPGATGWASATACAAPASVTCSFATTEATALGTYAFELQVTDSSESPETEVSEGVGNVTVDPALASPGGPTVLVPKLDLGQTPTVVAATLPADLGGTGAVSYSWLVAWNGNGFVAATSSQCTTPAGPASGGLTVDCSVGLTAAPGTYAYEVELTDSATSPQTAVSAAAGPVAVAAALEPPEAPTASAALLDVDQGLNVSGAMPSTGTPGYSWTWLVSVSGVPFQPATECGVNGGSGAGAGAREVCSVSPGLLTAGSEYAFELQVTDNATSPSTVASTASRTVRVSAALVAGPVTPEDPTIVSGSVVALTAEAAGGSGAYRYQWYAGSSPSCAADTALAGATAATYNASPVRSTFYCYVVTDSASVPVSVGSATDRVTVAPPASFLGLPPVEGYALVAGIIAAIAASALTVRALRRRNGSHPPSTAGGSGPPQPPP